MTLKYESEILFDLMKRDGDDTPSDVLPYESELKEKYLNQVVGAYPKLQDYRPEWLNYNLEAHLPADFPVETLSNVTSATVDNVVPYAYRSAILKGNTGYRDIDTGEFLETFEEGRNLELVSVKMPVLTTRGNNLNNQNYIRAAIDVNSGAYQDTQSRVALSNHIKINPNTIYSFKLFSKTLNCRCIYLYDINKDFIGITAEYKKADTFDSGDAHYLNFCGFKSADIPITQDEIVNANFMIIEGETKPISYEPYRTNILTVNEDVELRGIGDVQDTLDCLTGEVVQNIGEMVLDGSESWKESSQELTNTRLFYYGAPTNSNINTSKFTMINNRFASINPNTGGLWNTDVVGLGNGLANNAFRLRVLKSTANTIDELKEYLHSNPIVVQYELATPVIKTVELNIQDQDGNTLKRIAPIEGTMHIHSDGTPVKPTITMEIPVEAITQNLASFIEEE